MEGGPTRWRKVSDAVAGFLRADGKLAPIYAAAAEAQKAELEETIQKLMADGVSAAEILEKLK